MNTVVLRILVLVFFLPSIASCQEDEFNQWEGDIQAFERADRQNPPGADAILFVGSSSIRFWPNLDSEFPNHEILNRGFGGSEFSDVLHFADRLIFNYDLSKIFIYQGDNDIARGESPEMIMGEAIELRQMIASRLGENLPVIFISVKPSVARWHLRNDYMQLNDLLHDYASNTDNTYYADVWTPSLDEAGVVMDDIFIEDNLHLNAKGYAIWREVIAPFIDL